jgi:uncharacterized protein (UPF0548 family)
MQVPLWSFSKPTESTVRNFLNRQRTEEFAYRAVGATVGHPPRGYAYNDNQVHLGEGDAIFKQAVDALFSWEMFPKAWTGITALESGEIRLGLTLAVQAHACGLWWLNACRVVYLVDDSTPVRRRGFAYGTLPAHVEQGEELFSIEQWADGTVWYRVQAFSRPRYWPVRMAEPLARSLQAKFVRDSQAAMVLSVQTPV